MQIIDLCAAKRVCVSSMHHWLFHWRCMCTVCERSLVYFFISAWCDLPCACVWLCSVCVVQCTSSLTKTCACVMRPCVSRANERLIGTVGRHWKSNSESCEMNYCFFFVFSLHMNIYVIGHVCVRTKVDRQVRSVCYSFLLLLRNESKSWFTSEWKSTSRQTSVWKPPNPICFECRLITHHMCEYKVWIQLKRSGSSSLSLPFISVQFRMRVRKRESACVYGLWMEMDAYLYHGWLILSFYFAKYLFFLLVINSNSTQNKHTKLVFLDGAVLNSLFILRFYLYGVCSCSCAFSLRSLFACFLLLSFSLVRIRWLIRL